jgi:hypothetical protein
MGAGAAVAASALLALSATIGYKMYKRFLSQAARQCRGRKGVQKTNCMNKAKRDANKAKLIGIQKGLPLCSKTKNPGKCQAKLQRKITIAKAKLGQL